MAGASTGNERSAPPRDTLTEGEIHARLRRIAECARELGEERLLREAERALAAKQGRANGRGAKDPLAAFPRLLRDSRSKNVRACLRYLAAHPGASNREIAKALGKAENQICGMLERMLEEGLLDKRSGTPGKRNSWTLSSLGEAAIPILTQIEGP